MPDNLAEQYPGLIFLAIVIGLLLYGCFGGVGAFYRWRGIDPDSKKVQRWKASLVLVFLTLGVTIALVFSGAFVTLLGLVGLFTLAFVVTSLLLRIGSTVRKDLGDM